MASKCASKTLFVGNLHVSLEENDLLDIFRPFGRIVECCKRWCHYGFIQFATEDEARLAFNNLNGSKVRGRPMRIEFQRKKLRNIQALLEAEAEAKLHHHSYHMSEGGCGGGNSCGGSSNPSQRGSFEHLNLLTAASMMSNKLMSNSQLALTARSRFSPADVENVNPGAVMLSAPPPDLVFGRATQFGSSSLMPTQQPTTDEDEMLLFSNSMLLETCLLKVFDDDVNVDELPSRKLSTAARFTLAPATPSPKQVLKPISLNTNSFASNPFRAMRSPDFNNNGSRQAQSKHSTSTSSSCSSPVSQKDSSSSSSSSVVIPAFKCKSSLGATSIYVEPNEITQLEPLTEKDYPQYRLFPAPAIDVDMVPVDPTWSDTNKKLLVEPAASSSSSLGIFSPPLPPLSSSPASSCCTATTTSNSSMSDSPDYCPATAAQRRSSPFINRFFIK